ncbi:DNA topoisomerase (ATP-hydrolyzing) subunit A [Naumannella halotolerans]|uniref:DNA gyrase/topoisomerase IV subunit A n=1 Tax=Naumannella halotolerans TaxID=993414 RepID=UPI00370DB5EC
MARKTTTADDDFTERVLDVDVSSEMQTSFLEYAYSVIYSRALPDARDGLKPVQRRILFSMDDMNLRPDRGYVKCARVVGEVMGKLHPHSDVSIYDALVRMAQPWVMRVPMVDPHGNFGSPDAGPAAMRYTECRMATPTVAMTEELDQNTVDFKPNYDGKGTEPIVLPAAIPNLLVNGASGIAVGMATNMPPHNLVEVVQALRHLLKHPNAQLDTLMKYVPGPDLPTGGKIIGLSGIAEAYETGRGAFKIRATARIEQTSARRKGIVVTELPYTVGAEKIIEQIKTLVQGKRLQGIADVKDLGDLQNPTRLVIEVKNGFNPEAILDALYAKTKLEDSFSINNVALVEGQPRTLSLRDLLQVFLDHRLEVVLRRTTFARDKALDRLHLVDGLLIAIVDIDDVIAIIRGADDSAQAREKLIEVFELTETQAHYILDMQLRRLTKYSRIELEAERDDLRQRIADLGEIIDDPDRLRAVVGDELAEIAKKFGTPRRTVLLASSAARPTAATTELEIADDPCHVLLTPGGLIARTTDAEPLATGEDRANHDVIGSVIATTARADFGVVTSAGRMLRLSALDLPTLPPTAGPPNLQGGTSITELVSLERDEQVIALASLAEDAAGLALGTAHGVVKRVQPEVLGKESWDLIRLADGDRVVGAVQLADDTRQLAFVTSEGSLLHFAASAVRPQGRSGGGVAGIKLGAKAQVIWFGAVVPDESVLVTIAGSADALPGTEAGSVKVTPFAEYPAKGRATGGVRCHRFLKGEDRLLLAWAGKAPARAMSEAGTPVDLPPAEGRRDGSGTPTAAPIAGLGSGTLG